MKNRRCFVMSRYLSPSESEVSEASEMLRLFEEAQRPNKGVAVLNGRFIGPPMVLAAKQLLAKHALVTLHGK